MSTEFLILIILISILFVLFAVAGILFFVKFNKNKSSSINDVTSKDLQKKEHEVEKKIEQLKKHISAYEESKRLYEDKLLALSSKSEKELKEELFTILRNREKKEIESNLNELRQEANLLAANILMNTMQSLAEPLIQEHTTTSLIVEDDQTKGRIIGRDGRNKRAFEILTGTDLIIEKDSNFITISCHNPLRREMAKNVLEELIKIKSIDPSKIESTYASVKESFINTLSEIGKDVVENKLNIYDLNPEIYPYIGKLQFRSSYGQNALSHSLECACIAESLANELKIDRNTAVKCALLHDIGKSVDQELNTNHIDMGVKIAKKFNLSDEIINSIESHHGGVLCSTIYAEIAKLADSISAARPGARINSVAEHFKRVQELENIIKQEPEVKNAFVFRAGRNVTVFVNPLLVSDDDMVELGSRIKDKIENNELVKGYNIKVTLVKEFKYSFETERKN